MEIKLTLDINELNLVLGALGNVPYVQSAPLIDKIRSQAQPQVSESEGTSNGES
jgi:hypothetical protein